MIKMEGTCQVGYKMDRGSCVPVTAENIGCYGDLVQFFKKDLMNVYAMSSNYLRMNKVDVLLAHREAVEWFKNERFIQPI